MSQYPRLIHHGGASGVTGSCHQWFTQPDKSLMVDCGLLQGSDAHAVSAAPDGLLQALQFAPSTLQSLKAVLISHVHIDHVGRLPWLLSAGYSGPIYCSRPSALLLPAVMEDALAQSLTPKKRLIKRVVHQLEQQLVPLDWGEEATLWPGLTLTLQPAGHILGSVTLMLTQENGQRTLFSGDLGARKSPILRAPVVPERCDHLILESTYGNRSHSDRQHRRARLESALQRALADGGTVLIPAFSLGRTQELLYELEDIIHQQQTTSGNLRNLDVILDSPLAARFTSLYRQMQPFWNAEAHQRLRSGRKPLAFSRLLTITHHADHLRTVNYLAANHRPAVVIAASGMCAGGRIVRYLKAMLADPRHNVLFVGYQARGTPGHHLQQQGTGGHITLDNTRLRIGAGIETISGYSAHADQQDLLNFISAMQQPPTGITLVHGEARARKALAKQIQQRWPQITIVLPDNQ